jgi:HPt (histidine-containing phosphotransfer) domain-containing protein
MYHDNLRLFYDKIAGECDNMSAYAKSGDLKSFSFAAHSIKSALSGIGAAGMAKEAARLEAASRENDAEFCSGNLPGFLRAMLDLRGRLSEVFPAETPANNTGEKQGESGHLQEAVQKALEALDDFDIEAGMEAINGLSAFDFGERAGALLEKAADAMKKYDYIGAKDILMKLKQEETK